MTIMLEAIKVTKQFGGLTAVGDLSISVPEKSIYAVIGPNGAGKTTFFNCVTGFYKVTSGDVLLDGDSLVGLRPDHIAQRGISRTYQNIRLFQSLTALENVLIGHHPRMHAGWIGAVLNTPGTRKEEKDSTKMALDMLDFVGLKGFSDELAKNLPYGGQRRLEIARALASEPKLLLLDEPTAGMNPSETEDMTQFIQKLRDDLGITICLIEHDMRVVMQISETITVLDYGKKIAEGTPVEIRNNPQVIEAYLGRGAATQHETAESGAVGNAVTA